MQTGGSALGATPAQLGATPAQLGRGLSASEPWKSGSGKRNNQMGLDVKTYNEAKRGGGGGGGSSSRAGLGWE